jgi:hypothetical protein
MRERILIEMGSIHCTAMDAYGLEASEQRCMPVLSPHVLLPKKNVSQGSAYIETMIHGDDSRSYNRETCDVVAWLCWLWLLRAVRSFAMA